MFTHYVYVDYKYPLANRLLGEPIRAEIFLKKQQAKLI